MEFHYKDYDATNCKYIRRGIPMISFSKKGVVIFNKALCELMTLSHGSMVKFRHTSENEWYVYKTADKGGFPVRAYGKKNVNMIMNSAELVKKITKENCAFPVSSKPVDDNGRDLFFIITQKPVTRR